MSKGEARQHTEFGENTKRIADTVLRNDQLLVFIVFALILGGYVFGEKIAVHNGLGWDGYTYGSWVKDYASALDHGLPDYFVQRILPSGVIHYLLRLLSMPLTDPNIIIAFGMMNAVLLAVTAHLWCRIVRQMVLSCHAKLLGLMALFLNFACLKWLSYDPVLTDGYALAFGMGMLQAYLGNRRVTLWILAALGAFTWPALIYQSCFLILFPRRLNADQATSKENFEFHTWLASVIAVGIFLLLVNLVWKTDPSQQPIGAGDSWQPFSATVVVSAACVSAFLFFVVNGLWNRGSFFHPRFWLKSTNFAAVLALLVVLVGTRWLASRLSTGVPLVTAGGPLSIRNLLILFAWNSVRHPGISLVAHLVFFGPILILAVLRWKQVAGSLNGHGLGLTLCTTFNLFLSVDSESRHLFHFLPIIVYGLCKAMDSTPLHPQIYATLALLCLIFSKVWLHIGGNPDTTSPEAMLKFSSQRIFMNLGPFMSGDMYLAQGGAVLLAGVLIAWLLAKQASRATRFKAP